MTTAQLLHALENPPEPPAPRVITRQEWEAACRAYRQEQRSHLSQHLQLIHAQIDPCHDSCRTRRETLQSSRQEDLARWTLVALACAVIGFVITGWFGADIAIVAGLCFILLTLPFWQ